MNVSKWDIYLKRAAWIFAIIAIIFITYTFNNYQEAKIVKGDLDQKYMMMKIVNTALNDIRKDNEKIRLNCKYNADYGLKQMSKESFSREIARENLKFMLPNVRNIFNEDAVNDIQEFIKYDASIIDICGKSAPDDTAWASYVYPINEDFSIAIEADKRKINKLQGLSS